MEGGRSAGRRGPRAGGWDAPAGRVEGAGQGVRREGVAGPRFP